MATIVSLLQNVMRYIYNFTGQWGLAIVGLGILVILGPSSVPGLTPSM